MTFAVPCYRRNRLGNVASTTLAHKSAGIHVSRRELGVAGWLAGKLAEKQATQAGKQAGRQTDRTRPGRPGRQAGRQLSRSEDGVSSRVVSLFYLHCACSSSPSAPYHPLVLDQLNRALILSLSLIPPLLLSSALLSLSLSPPPSHSLTHTHTHILMLTPHVPLRASPFSCCALSLPLFPPSRNLERIGRVHQACEGSSADHGSSRSRSAECVRRCESIAPVSE